MNQLLFVTQEGEIVVLHEARLETLYYDYWFFDKKSKSTAHKILNKSEYLGQL